VGTKRDGIRKKNPGEGKSKGKKLLFGAKGGHVKNIANTTTHYWARSECHVPGDMERRPWEKEEPLQDIRGPAAPN